MLHLNKCNISKIIKTLSHPVPTFHLVSILDYNCCSCVQLIGQEFEEETALGLCLAITKHLQEAEAQKHHNHNW